MQSPLRYGSLTRRVNVAVWVLLAKLGESGTRSSACFDYRSAAVSKFGDVFRSGFSDRTELSASGIKLKLASRNAFIADRPLS